jgi:restriction endonuclease
MAYIVRRGATSQIKKIMFCKALYSKSALLMDLLHAVLTNQKNDKFKTSKEISKTNILNASNQAVQWMQKSSQVSSPLSSAV